MAEVDNKDSEGPPFFEPLVGTNFEGNSTTKETFSSRPDIIIRYSPDDNPSFEEVALARKEFVTLRDTYKFPISPFEIVQGNEFYTITKRINGENLEIALSHLDSIILNQFQDINIALLHYLRDRNKPGSPFLTDIYGPNQYMYGSLPGNEKKQIYLIDIDPRICNSSGKLWVSNWLRVVKYIAEDIVNAETRTGQKFDRARKVLIQLLGDFPKETMYTQGKRMINKILQGKKVSYEEWSSKI